MARRVVKYGRKDIWVESEEGEMMEVMIFMDSEGAYGSAIRNG